VSEISTETEADVFRAIVRRRRSVRRFMEEGIPEGVVRDCLESAVLAPNSSNLQTWYFRWVRDPGKKAALAEACMGQNAAKTASDLIIVTTRVWTWPEHAQWNLEHYPAEKMPGIVRTYYAKLAYLMYSVGPLSILAPLKRLLFWGIGLRRPMVRGLFTRADQRVWAVKSAALASENLMLAFVSHGYDTCPMEGFDAVRVRKLFGIPRGEEIVMIVGAGRAAENGIYHERYRIPLDDLLEKI